MKFNLHNLLSALSYIHFKDIAHNDIKANNILIFLSQEKDWHIKLADFEYAKIGKEDNI